MLAKNDFIAFHRLDRNLIEETLASEGFKMVNEIKLLAVSLEPCCDAKEMFFATATLEEV